MTAPFGTDATLFALCGLTYDDFVLPDTRMVRLDQLIEEHLLSIGYRGIAFYHSAYGLREVGPEIVSADQSIPADRARPRPASGLIGGPLGKMRLVEPALAPVPALPDAGKGRQRSEAEGQGRSAPNHGDLSIPTHFRAFLNSGKGPRAYVFEDADYLLRDLHPDALKALSSNIREVARGRSNKAICIFVSDALSAVTYRAEDHDRNHFFFPFRDKFFVSGGLTRPNVIRIGAPDREEVLSMQRRLRLRVGIATDFSLLQSNVDLVAAHIRAGWCEAEGQKKGPPDLATMGLRENEKFLQQYPWDKAPAQGSALEALRNLVGRRKVFEKIEEDILFAKSEFTRLNPTGNTKRDISNSVGRVVRPTEHRITPAVNLNYVLLGQPGTGKTVIARLIARAMKESGILPSGHFIEVSAEDFVAGFVGQTEVKSAELLDGAIGGTIFVDEIQKFGEGTDFHKAAVRTMLTYLENLKGRMSIILATYLDEFEKFLNIEKGLSSRLPQDQRIELPDYTGSEAAEIFRRIAGDSGTQIAPGFDMCLEHFFENWVSDGQAKAPFENGRTINTLVEMMRKAAARSRGALDKEHVPAEQAKYIAATGRSRDGESALNEALEELNALVGLEDLKTKIKELVDSARAARRRNEPILTGPGHFSFEGASGTGKTTAATLMGEIFRKIGLLKSGHVIPTDRQGLVSRYSGGTAHDVDALVNKAMDGVLFIDEAHNLAPKGGNDTYGQEAIGTLTNRMENQRDRLCVILAGYTQDMARLFEQDKGWKSRVDTRIQFANYNATQTAEIVRSFVKRHNRKLEPTLDAKLEDISENLIAHEGADFANGRSARNLVKRMTSRLDSRLESAPEDTDPYTIIMADVPEHLL